LAAKSGPADDKTAKTAKTASENRKSWQSVVNILAKAGYDG